MALQRHAVMAAGIITVNPLTAVVDRSEMPKGLPVSAS
jgi:hypothetical protein